MRTRLTALALSGVAALALAGPVAATPVTTGCSSGSLALTVEQWAAMGYPGPANIDAAGNQNGIVCGHPLPEGFTFGWAITAQGFTPTNAILYLFNDDTNPAKR